MIWTYIQACIQVTFDALVVHFLIVHDLISTKRISVIIYLPQLNNKMGTKAKLFTEECFVGTSGGYLCDVTHIKKHFSPLVTITCSYSTPCYLGRWEKKSLPEGERRNLLQLIRHMLWKFIFSRLFKFGNVEKTRWS